jgi:hypothetical protein
MEEVNEGESKPLLWSERIRLLKKSLTERTLLEMFANATIQELIYRPEDKAQYRHGDRNSVRRGT